MFPIILEVLHAYVSHRILANVVKIVSKQKEKTEHDMIIFNYILANPCANNPCGANGQCIASNGAFYCECNLGFYGNRCERKQKLLIGIY